MSHIQKVRLKNGTAHSVYWSVKGIRYKKYFDIFVPFADVKQFAATVESRKHADPITVPRRILLSEVMTKFEEQRGVDIATWRHRIAMQHFIDFADDITCDRVTPEVIHHFRDWLLSERLKTATDVNKTRRGVNHDLMHVSIVFKWAFRQGILPDRPFERVQFLKTVKPRPDVLTKDEMNKFRLCLPRKYRFVFHFLRFTGLRIGEACAVRICDVDTAAREIRLYKTKNRDEISIPLARQLVRIAKYTDWLNRAPETRVIPVQSHTVSHNFRFALTKAGIFKKMPTHLFRHTAGRRILEAYYTTGNAHAIAKKFLRHKSDAMTEHYQQTYIEDIRKAMESVQL